jgi:hypothetical protein
MRSSRRRQQDKAQNKETANHDLAVNILQSQSATIPPI